MRKALGILAAFLAVGWLSFLLSLGGAGRGLVALLFYIGAAYVLFRAWPGIRADLALLRGRRFGRLFAVGRHAGRGGDL